MYLPISVHLFYTFSPRQARILLSPAQDYAEAIWSAAALLPLFPMTRATPFFGETQQFVAELVDW